MMNVTSVKRIHQSDWTDSGVRFLRARDIVAAAKNEEPDDYLYISKEKYEEYSTLSGKVGVSDLLVTGVGTIGVPYLVRNLEPLYFKDGNIIWFQNSDKIDGKFLFYSFSAEQIQGFINESAGIGTVGTYTIESGKKTPISLPDQIEQAKVGEFFQSARPPYHPSSATDNCICGNSQYTKSNFSRKTVFCSTDGTKIPLITLCE